MQLIAAQAPLLEQREASCCYAKSDKYWITDPQGIAWETYHTLDSIPVFGGDPVSKPEAQTAGASPCCVPSAH